MSRKVVGQAVATAAGYYPDDGVHCRMIPEGEVFNVVEGLEKAAWFKRIDAEPAAKTEAKPRKKSDADKEREQVKAESTPPDDIA